MAIFTVQKNFVKEKKYIFRQKSQSPQNGKNGQKICSFDWSWQLTEYKNLLLTLYHFYIIIATYQKNLFFNAVRQENPMRKENKEPVRSGLKKLLGFVYTEFGQTASYKQKKGAVLCKNKRIKSRLYTQM